VVLASDLGNSFFLQIPSGIEKTASCVGYCILTVDTGQPDFGRDRILEHVSCNRAGGMIALDGSLPVDAYANECSIPIRRLCLCANGRMAFPFRPSGSIIARLP